MIKDSSPPSINTVCSVSVRIFFFLLISGMSVFAQSEKVHEFEGTNCESQRADIDVLLKELESSPSAKGVIVFQGEYKDPVTAYTQRETISNHLRFRKFNIDRIVFVLGKSERVFRTELWKTTDIELDRFTGVAWDFTLKEITVPVLVHAESWINGIGCGLYLPDLRFYSKFLIANKSLSGRVIIRDRSITKFNKIKTKIIGELVTKFKVPKNNLEFAYIEDEWPDIEYWYFPSNTFPRTTMP